MNPLTSDELLLAEEEMKGFKIPTDKEIEDWKKSEQKRLKVSNTSTINRSTSSVAAVFGSVESSLNTTLSQKRARV